MRPGEVGKPSQDADRTQRTPGEKMDDRPKPKPVAAPRIDRTPLTRRGFAINPTKALCKSCHEALMEVIEAQPLTKSHASMNEMQHDACGAKAGGAIDDRRRSITKGTCSSGRGGTRTRTSD